MLRPKRSRGNEKLAPRRRMNEFLSAVRRFPDAPQDAPALKPKRKKLLQRVALVARRAVKKRKEKFFLPRRISAETLPLGNVLGKAVKPLPEQLSVKRKRGKTRLRNVKTDNLAARLLRDERDDFLAVNKRVPADGATP